MVYYITGGQKSGKSVAAERLALSLSSRPVYLATARVLDEEVRHRVEVHKARRASHWDNLEEPLRLSRFCEELSGRVVLVDCVTHWAANVFFDYSENVGDALGFMRKEIDALLETDAIFIFVSNEIGLGGIGGNEMQRKFTDLQGQINQDIAARADKAMLVVSGLTVDLK